jgi:two-component system, response regulator
MVPILVIDDSQQVLLLAKRVIRRAKVLNPVHLFRYSAEFTAYFSGASAETAEAEPALMFVDLVMFPKNGIEVLKSLKRFPLARESITVMLTGLGDVRHIQRGYEAGATTFLIKPFSIEDFENFLRAFKKHFRIRETPEGRYLEWAKIDARDTAQIRSSISAPNRADEVNFS